MSDIWESNPDIAPSSRRWLGHDVYITRYIECPAGLVASAAEPEVPCPYCGQPQIQWAEAGLVPWARLCQHCKRAVLLSPKGEVEAVIEGRRHVLSRWRLEPLLDSQGRPL